MSSLEVSKLSFVKAQLYGLGFANATFYLSSFKLQVFFAFIGYFLHLLLSTLLQLLSAISNNTFTEVDFWTTFYTTGYRSEDASRK